MVSWVALICCFFVASAVPSAVPSGVAGAAEPIPPKAVVWIEPIADSGGADQKMGDGETLARRFTKGLRAALEGEAHERFDVRLATRSAGAASPAARFVLRGGLSRVQGSGEASQDPQPYLCIVRLFQESVFLAPGGSKKTRHLIGQWAGTARGLRDLTGNLARDPRVHALGLAGELSRRISSVIAPSAPAPPAAAAPGEGSPPAVLILEGSSATQSPAISKSVPAGT